MWVCEKVRECEERSWEEGEDGKDVSCEVLVWGTGRWEAYTTRQEKGRLATGSCLDVLLMSFFLPLIGIDFRFTTAFITLALQLKRILLHK